MTKDQFIQKWGLNIDMAAFPALIDDATSVLSNLEVEQAYNQGQTTDDPFICSHCGSKTKHWSRKNNDWYCSTCGYICKGH